MARVATVYEDEHGDLYMEEDKETKAVLQTLQAEEQEEALVEGINTLELAEQYENDFSEADFIRSDHAQSAMLWETNHQSGRR